MRIQIPRPQWSSHTAKTTTTYETPVSATPTPLQQQSQQTMMMTMTKESTAAATVVVAEQPVTNTWQNVKKVSNAKSVERKKSATATPRKNSSHHASSGRPSRVKGPCQACHETSDGCMRKAFNWPFPTSTIFNDKGKPFVYLCNKCGLR
jgi:hypothetical protein